MRVYDALCVVNTWANSWATSRRYAEVPKFPCMLGCHAYNSASSQVNELDDLAQYLNCMAIRSILTFILPEIASECSPGLFGLDNICVFMGVAVPRVEAFQTLVCLFYAYHSLKHMRSNPIANPSFELSMRTFLGSFCAAARDLGLCTAERSVASLFAFLRLNAV